MLTGIASDVAPGSLAGAAQALQQIREIRRQRRLEQQRTPIRRMVEAQLTGVQRLPAKRNRPQFLRPEVVARGRMLAADPDYPRMDDLRVVAQQTLRSRDLSEDDL